MDHPEEEQATEEDQNYVWGIDGVDHKVTESLLIWVHMLAMTMAEMMMKAMVAVLFHHCKVKAGLI